MLGDGGDRRRELRPVAFFQHGLDLDTAKPGGVRRG